MLTQDPQTTEDDLGDVFTQKCSVDDIRVIKHNGQSKGFAYLDLADRDSLKQALALNGTKIGKRVIKVDVQQSRQSPRGKGGGRG